MENRDAIVRKLNALKAKFEHGTTNEHEAQAAMEAYNRLMQKYNLTETDLHVRESGIDHKTFKHGNKQNGPMFWVVVGIGNVTDTKPIGDPATKSVTFFGTGPDVQYAEFLYRLIEGSLKLAWKSYRYSFEYTRQSRAGVHGKIIRNAFEKGFIFQMHERLEAMAAENKKVGTGLIVLKNQLIKAHLDDMGMKTKASNVVARYQDNSALKAGMDEADKVRLRQEAESKTLYLEGK